MTLQHTQTHAGSQHIFYLTGDFKYNCPGFSSENLSVVEAQYSIALCRGCEGQYTLNVGEVLSWSLAEKDSVDMCNISIKNTNTDQLLQSEKNSHSMSKYKERYIIGAQVFFFFFFFSC